MAPRLRLPLLARSLARRCFSSAREGRISALSSLSYGATVHHAPSVPNNAGIHGCAARYFNTFPCPRAATKTNCSTTSMPSIIINHLKPACVDSSGGVKGSFSYTTSTRNEISRNAKMAAWATEWDAKSAAWQARWAAWEAEIET